MPQPTDVANVCCVAIELSKSSWVIAFSPPADCGKASVHQIAAKDINRLLSFLESARSKAEREASRPLEIVVCYEVGYDGFWLARVLIARGIRTIVFDPASFLMPRKGRRAKTDRLDAEGMTRTLRAWLSGDREVARDVRIPTVEEEDAKRIERERKHLVEQRTSVVGRIKGLLALHGIHLSGKRIGTGLQGRLDHIKTGDGRNLAPFLRRDLERMLRHYEFICDQIKDNIDYIFGLAGNAALDALVAEIADNLRFHHAILRQAQEQPAEVAHLCELLLPGRQLDTAAQSGGAARMFAAA
jgi:transposase